jgi:phage shock protein A
LTTEDLKILQEQIDDTQYLLRKASKAIAELMQENKDIRYKIGELEKENKYLREQMVR